MKTPMTVSSDAMSLLDKYRELHLQLEELLEDSCGDLFRPAADDMLLCFALNDACRAIKERLRREWKRELKKQRAKSAEKDNSEKPEETVVPEMVTLKEAAARTGMSYDFLRKGCLSGQFAHVRCGSKILINFDKLVETLNTAGRKK